MKTLDQPCALRPPLDPVRAAFFWRSKAYTLLKVDVTAEDGDGNNVAANPNGSFTPPFSPVTPEITIPPLGNIPIPEFSEDRLYRSALVIYYQDVIEKVEDEWQLKNFDVKFNLPDELTGVEWSQKSGPSGSGTLIDADKPKAIFRNPTKGGLYEFELSIGGNLLSTFQVWLPLAGPGIESYWEGEISYFKNIWGPLYRDKLFSSLPTLGGGRPGMFTFARHDRALKDMLFLIGINLDWTGQVSGDISPSGGPLTQGARQTLHGVTSPFHKRNNMMYALIGREMTIDAAILQWGPNALDSIEPGAAGSRDDQYTFESYLAGFDLFNDVPLSEVMENRGIEMLPPDRWGAREWPSDEHSDGTLFRKANAELFELIN